MQPLRCLCANMTAYCYLHWPSTALTADVRLSMEGISELDIHEKCQPNTDEKL